MRAIDNDEALTTARNKMAHYRAQVELLDSTLMLCVKPRDIRLLEQELEVAQVSCAVWTTEVRRIHNFIRRKPAPDDATDLRSSFNWLKAHPETVVLDPDGWDRKRLDESMAELITVEEFKRRVSRSTHMIQVPRETA